MANRSTDGDDDPPGHPTISLPESSVSAWRTPARLVEIGPILLVAVIVLVGVTGTVLAVDSQVSIESVEISPETVEPGEPFIAEGTIRNAESSDTPASITEVGIRGPNTLETHDDLGTIGSGETMTVPVSLTLSDPGQHELTFFVHGRDVGGERFYYTYPVYVTVEEPASGVRLSISSPDAVAGEGTPVNVTVANGDDAAISSLEITLAGESVSVREPRRVSSRLDAGTDQTFTYDVTFEDSGSRPLTATLDFRTGENYRQTITDTSTVTVDGLRVDADVSATVHRNGSQRTVRSTVENFGNVDLEDVVVRIERNEEVLERIQAPDVSPGESATVDIDADGFPAATLDVVASYEAAGQRGSASRQLSYSPAVESRIDLTGVDVTRSPTGVTISGDAANVGEMDATAVLLHVIDGDGVTPVNPHREYFVGSIDASEFATFELTAEIDPMVTSIPVEVRYTVDGERRSSTVPIDVGDAAGDPDADEGSDGPSLLLPAVGFALLAVVIAGVLWWRRRR